MFIVNITVNYSDTHSQIDYSMLLDEQTGNLHDRDESIVEYKDMLKKVEAYQKQAIRVLEVCPTLSFSFFFSLGIHSHHFTAVSVAALLFYPK